MQVAAIRALEPLLVGLPSRRSHLGAVYRRLAHDSQLRWLGPEKGVMHMAVGAVVNALWDLAAKRAGQPLWKLLSDLSPEQLVELVDFRYLTRRAHARRGAGHPAPRASTDGPSARTGSCATAIPRTPRRPAGSATPTRSSPGCAREAVAAGYGQIKLKVGGDLEDDVRRLRIAREACGPDIRIAVDANQRWDVGDAIAVGPRAGALRSLLDRGADEPGRRARPRRDRGAASRRSGSPRASTSRTA